MGKCCLIHLNSAVCQRLLSSAAIVKTGRLLLLVRSTAVLSPQCLQRQRLYEIPS
jgi:hypothetical protein